MPRPRTGQTPIQHIRINEADWAAFNTVTGGKGAATFRAFIDWHLRRKGSKMPPQSNAIPELNSAYPGWRDLASELSEITPGLTSDDQAGVVLWRALTGHPGDREQQYRVILTYLLARADKANWQGSTAELGAAITALLEEHLPR